MALHEDHAGIHLTSTKLRLVEVGSEAKKYLLENVDEVYYNDLINFDEKETKLITVLQSALNEISYKKPLTAKQISFALPSNVFRIFTVPFEEALRKNDLEEHLRWELSVLYPFIDLGNISIQSIKVSESGILKKKSIIVLGISKNILKMLNKLCRRNNFTLKYVDNEHAAANNNIILENYSSLGNLYLSVFLAENYVSLIMLENGMPVYVKYREQGATSDPARILNYELSVMASELELTSDISLSYLFCDHLPDDDLAEIRKETGLGLNRINPFNNITLNDALTSDELVKSKSRSFASAAGLAYRL